jgi:glycosyltransferase involved in cell wall biosynthesis
LAATPTHPDVLLILRTPPPYAGGEMIGQQLEQCFSGRYSLLVFRRPGHARADQGRVTAANLGFGLRFVVRSSLHLIRVRPRVLYVDIPKDGRSFLRNSAILVVALALRVRVVGDLAGADFQFLRRRTFARAYGRWLLRRLAAIRVLGEAIAATLSAHGLDNAVVVSNGIDEPPGAAVTRALGPELSFLYVGKLAEAKGILTLLDFVGELVAAGHPGRLHLVGEWESAAFEAQVLARIDADRLGDRVQLHGLLVNDAKWQVFRAADVLLHPTRWDGQPVTILEALAFGLPVVATEVGAIPDTIRSGHNGYLMRDHSSAELWTGVRAITRDAECYAGYSVQARASFLDRFTSAQFERSMAALFDGM